jgi:hypothetical protein
MFCHNIRLMLRAMVSRTRQGIGLGARHPLDPTSHVCDAENGIQRTFLGCPLEVKFDANSFLIYFWMCRIRYMVKRGRIKFLPRLLRESKHASLHDKVKSVQVKLAKKKKGEREKRCKHGRCCYVFPRFE